MYWLLLAGPLTYLMRVGGLLLSRTRLAPRRMGATLALVSPAVLAALVVPSLLRPTGHLAASPLDNPRLLVGLLLVPLILALRRQMQVLLVVTLVLGMGLLCGLLWWPGMMRSLPLVLLFIASAGLVLVIGRQLPRLRQRQPVSASGGGPVQCVWCLCPLPAWADACGSCGFPAARPSLAATRLLPAPARSSARGSERPSAWSSQQGAAAWRR